MGRFSRFTAALLILPYAQGASAQAGKDVDFATVRHIVAVRCRFCHTAVPQEDGLNATSQPPKGVKFDTPDDIRLLAARIEEQAVKLKRMPPDNATHMTEAERITLETWIAGGAKLP